MIKTEEALFYVQDIIPVEFNGKKFFDIILRERDTYKDKTYDTFIPCQMAYKSQQTMPEVGSTIKCKLDVMSKEKNGRYLMIFSLYKYIVEKAADNIANTQSEPEIEQDMPFDDSDNMLPDDIGF